eukprot:symbB.v1.2.010495.t1/scaffold647.1/size176639/3
MGRVRIARCIALLVAVQRTQGLATSAFSESFSGAAADGLRLRVISWNVAAVNNNPFEYWITHPKSEYKQLMDSVENSISNPGKEDVLVHEVFTDEMFQTLAQQMRSAELEGVDFVEKLWVSTYRPAKAKGQESPRSVAHKKLLLALSNLDADALRKALQEAALVGVDQEGLAAVQVALQELEAPGCIGTLQERQRAAAKLEVVAKDGTEMEIQDAILEAIDVGLEDGFKPAENALAKRRSQRHEVMEALVAAMEVAVVSAEQDGINGPGCCAPEHLEALADVLVEARSLAIPGEEELLNAATRLLEFELKRSEAVRTLNVKLRQHARDMEKIVDDLQQTTNAPSISAGSRATGILEAALDTTTPQWTRQSFLRRGSRRSKDHGGVADEVPAIPGVGMEAMEMRPDLKALAANSGPLAQSKSSLPSPTTPRSVTSPSSSTSPRGISKSGTLSAPSVPKSSSTLGYPKSTPAPEIPRPMQAPRLQPKATATATTAPTATTATTANAPMAKATLTPPKTAGIQIGGRRIISEFLRDPVIGKKRLASMPDRVTNTIQLLQGRTYRPSVVNCYVGELGSLEVWFNKWLTFFFDEDVHLDSSGSKKVYSLLQKIRKKKYPAISDEEEAASIPLQLMMQGIFDAILMRLMLKADVSGGWEELRQEICESLNSKKSQLIQGILEETYQDADVLFLQEAGTSALAPTLLASRATSPNVEPAKPAEREEAEIESESSDSQEEQGRNGDWIYFGWDFTPILPYVLSCSTVLGGTGMLFIQVPLLATNTFIPQVWIMATFATLYAITFWCMSYAAFVDPGQVTGDGDSVDIEKGMPLRAHKSWQYPQPVRRYDHFCRWINNTIGLHNHREFVIMVGTLLLIAFLGMGIDLFLLSSFLGTIASQRSTWD